LRGGKKQEPINELSKEPPFKGLTRRPPRLKVIQISEMLYGGVGALEDVNRWRSRGLLGEKKLNDPLPPEKIRTSEPLPKNSQTGHDEIRAPHGESEPVGLHGERWGPRRRPWGLTGAFTTLNPASSPSQQNAPFESG